MTDNADRGVARLRAKIGADTVHEAADGVERDEGITDEDAAALRKMSNRIRLLGESKFSTQRHEFYLRRNFVLARDCGNLAAVLDDRDEAERVVGWINTHKTGSPETNADYRVALRGFGRIIEGGDDPPETLEWVPAGYPSNYDPAPDPSKMYHWEEHILPMLDACHNSRDRALIALAWDAGPRAGELFDLTLDRITDHKYGLQVTFHRGKQGSRSPILIPSVPYVRQWIQDHPADEGENVSMWCALKSISDDGITNNRLRDIFKERARAADMTTPSTPTPTQMRKSSASYLASQGVSQAHLEDHHGWSRGSKKASRYVAVFGDANDREIARAHGLDVEADESADISPKSCPRCGQSTPREKDRCVWCGQALTPTATKTATDQQNEVLQAAGDLTGEQAAAFAELGQLMNEHPELHSLFED